MRWRKVLRWTTSITSTLLFLALFWPIRCYHYEPPRPFSGGKWYNPFQSDTILWSRANFHIHSRTWGGLTQGQNTPAAIDSAYRALGFAYYAISDYQRVNPASPIPVYEHGWGLRKYHQLLFDPKSILWWDFPWPFHRDIYQSVLTHLSPTTPLIAIAHPYFRPYHTCPSEIFRYLGGFHAIEVLNRYGDSFSAWDSALSAGHYATILANDNLHDVHNPHQITTRWTEIALPQKAAPTQVIQAILMGQTVGYKNIYAVPIAAHDYPTFRKIQIIGDTLFVVASEKVDSLRVIGQGGTIRATFFQTDRFTYPIRGEDTYLRVEMHTARVEAYTSPLCRGGEPTRRPLPREDQLRTWLWRVLLLAGAMGWLYLIALR